MTSLAERVDRPPPGTQAPRLTEHAPRLAGPTRGALADPHARLTTRRRG